MNIRIMNKNNSRLLAAVLAAAFAAWMAPLKAQTEEQIEQFRKDRREFFTERLELTDKECDDFWPMFEDFHNRKMKLVEDEKNTFKYAHRNAEHLSDAEIVEALEKIHTLKEKQHNLEQEYFHEKFMKVLPPKKVLMLYKVEWDFRKYLLRKIRGHEHGGRGKRGPGIGGGPPEGFEKRPGGYGSGPGLSGGMDEFGNGPDAVE